MKHKYALNNPSIAVLLIMTLLVQQTITGPISAYTACTVCCSAVHSSDWFAFGYGAVSTGFCILNACFDPIPGPTVDPRDNACALIFQGMFYLPIPWSFIDFDHKNTNNQISWHYNAPTTYCLVFNSVLSSIYVNISQQLTRPWKHLRHMHGTGK